MFSVQQVEITSTQCRYNRSREPCLWLVVWRYFTMGLISYL